MMRLIDEILVPHGDSIRSIRLYVGDLANLPPDEAVDLLVVSAFPGDHYPTSSSLIGALHQRGISVAALAAEKAVDLREFSACWLSEQIKQPGTNFCRILCFEPAWRGAAAEVVGDVFRSIVPFTTGSPPIKTLAMPILAAGDQGNDAPEMLRAMLEASIPWLQIGLALECIKIVAFSERHLNALHTTFTQVKEANVTGQPTLQRGRRQYDAFISYSHQNWDHVNHFINELLKLRPGLRLFVDRLELLPGTPWQQHIYEAIDESAKVVPFLSPDYVGSKMCKEEYNIAQCRHREIETGVLLPLYLLSAQLPTYMKLAQWVDCREAERGKLARAAADMVQHL